MNSEPNESDGVYRYRRLAEQISAMMRAESLQAGDFLPAERVLAKRFKVAFLTVRRALAFLAEKGFIRKIPRQGSMIIQIPPNAAGRKRIGITVWLEAGSDHPATLARLATAGKNFSGEHYDVIVIYITHEMLKKNDWTGITARNDLDGLLVTVQEIPAAVLKQLEQLPLPVVFQGLPEHRPGYWIDAAKGMELLMDYLTERGHRHIAMITRRTENCPLVEERIRLFRKSCGQRGISDRNIFAAGDYNRNSGLENTLNLLQSGCPVTAIIYDDDTMAQGGLDAIQQAGYTCPGDIAITSCGEVGQISRNTHPSITTLREVQDTSELCCKLLKQIVDGELIVSGMGQIPQELVVRESTMRAHVRPGTDLSPSKQNGPINP